jgi:hypothetical protein
MQSKGEKMKEVHPEFGAIQRLIQKELRKLLKKLKKDTKGNAEDIEYIENLLLTLQMKRKPNKVQ